MSIASGSLPEMFCKKGVLKKVHLGVSVWIFSDGCFCITWGFKLKKTKEKNISILVQGKWLRQSKRFNLVCLDYLC